ncbi:nucleolar protein 14 [Caerostris extrusa]|uniref:Nucleolar protein 14 n=1 Tax=Caerostris extrusa TaxID=172846 RepID=A0AAV4X9A8_CAEEX|nr:nucleolar protein 14 [Caerostris extrusa]
MAEKNFSKKVTFKGENNPFNLKLNREKHTVLGQKAKGTKGLRSISRANSHLKRKELYNKTRKTFEKANSFVDRRLLDESAEDSITARFVQERKKKLKKNKFNLNDDDDDLTHKGVPLHALKKLNHDQPSSDDDDDNEQLDAAFVKKAHFGGFASGLNQEPPSHKEIINQLILDSKQQKHEKKMEKELALELNETMKQNWRATYGKVTSKTNQRSVEIKKHDSVSESDNIQAMLKLTMQKPSVISETNQKSTETLEWKSLAQMTKYSIKGTPSVHTKSAEELNQEEEKKQLELEQERCQRMVDNKEIKANSKNHLSADSILDDFDFEPMVVEENINEKHSDSDKDSDYSDGDESVDSDTSEFISGNDKIDIELNSQNNLTNDNDESINLPISIEELEKLLKVPFHMCNKDTFEKLCTF